MLKYPILLESALTKWVIFGDKHRIPNYARVLLSTHYGKELEMLRNKVCPWCGRRFATKRGMWLHFKGAKTNMGCSFAFYSMIRNVIGKYMKEKHAMIVY